MNEKLDTCPKCGEALDPQDGEAGSGRTCPHCEEVLPAPDPVAPVDEAPATVAHSGRYPIIIRSSPRALLARYIWKGLGWLVGLIAAGVLSYFAAMIPHELGRHIAHWIIWGGFAILISRTVYQFIRDYLRISHTVYRVFPDKIELTSYIFKFMGVFNNTVRLSQLRQIQAFSNSRLDVWFFKCGRIVLTVSGDDSDFAILNVHRPARIRRTIEAAAFGSASKATDQSTPGVYQG